MRRKTVPAPMSASDAGHFDAEYFDPAQLTINNGLTITAQRSNAFANYSWKSGVVCTHGLWKTPPGKRCYIQFFAQMPDTSQGMWPGLWFLEGGGEIDGHEGGFGSAPVNYNMAVNLHTGGNSQFITSVGVDLSAGFNTYGMEYVPGVSVKMYFNDTLKKAYLSNVPTGAMTILITLQVAQNTSGWHTMPVATTPNGVMQVKEVQAYA